jgi:hypothetical protein
LTATQHAVENFGVVPRAIVAAALATFIGCGRGPASDRASADEAFDVNPATVSAVALPRDLKMIDSRHDRVEMIPSDQAWEAVTYPTGSNAIDQAVYGYFLDQESCELAAKQELVSTCWSRNGGVTPGAAEDWFTTVVSSDFERMPVECVRKYSCSRACRYDPEGWKPVYHWRGSRICKGVLRRNWN